MVFYAVFDFVPSGAVYHLDVLGSFCLYEAMSVRLLHGAAVVHYPDAEGEAFDCLSEGRGVAARVALGY